MQQIIIYVLILLSAIPIGLLAKHLTKDEKPIYKNYFKPILWIVAIAAAIFYSLDLKIALTLTFIFILLFVWNK
tara:strand:+ start:7095 stop:7316 length:222 start_codon:yes stop_codon:yes gene_type:complete